MAWSHFHHGADIGVRGTGETPAEAFEEAARALTGVITDPRGVNCLEEVAVNCEAPDLELLLVDWLNELIFEMAVRHLLFGRFRVELAGLRLRGTAWGEAVDLARHQPAVEVKGATLTELQVAEEAPGLWCAGCVVDV
jgi:SHS2 domain-containing protein